jgi:o-succinylbenzoate synthase
VRIEAAELQSFRLRLRRPLVTALGPLAFREGVLLSLRSTHGCTGYGEATPLPVFGTESLDAARRSLEVCASSLEGADLGEPEELLGWIDRRCQPTSTARAAIDCALHDLVARDARRSMASWLAAKEGRSARPAVTVSALLASRSPRDLALEAQHAVEVGFRTLKLKVGAGPASSDLERVAAVRTAVGPAPRIRADANGAWSTDEARARLEALASLDLEFVEQPVAAGDVAGLAQVRRDASVPVAADESACSEAELRAVLDAEAADVVILKPSAVGGISRARAAAELARAAGVEVVPTSFLDGAVAVLGALHLASSLPGHLPACGLATSALLENDLAPPPLPERGRLRVPTEPGLGARPWGRSRGRAA